MVKRIYIICTILTMCLSTTTAQDSIVPHRSLAVAFGSRQFLDTYLSAEHYSGFDMAFTTETQRMTKWDRWAWKSLVGIDFASMSNRADNNTTLEMAVSYQFSLTHYWTLAEGRLLLGCGGAAEASVGGAYNMRNQNNPAQLRTGIQLKPEAEAIFTFNILKKKSILRYNVSTPVLGFVFSPKYGQSYYEISQDNALHNFNISTFVSTPSLRQQLTLDFPVNKSYIRIGYLGNYRQSKINQLKYHSYEHAFMIGYIKQL